MFKWYQNAMVCYTFLDDVDIHETEDEKEGYIQRQLKKSAWFTRGWTLQELLAPDTLVFFDKNWVDIGTKTSLGDAISEITGIDDLFSWSGACIAQKISWASNRETTRAEDMAYCLMGLFDMNMHPLYGEGGAKAFMRLQLKIIKSSSDESLLAWGSLENGTHFLGPGDFLAPSPSAFMNYGQIRRRGNPSYENFFRGKDQPFMMTNKGLRISLFLIPIQIAGIDLYSGRDMADAKLKSDPIYVALFHGFCVGNSNLSPAILLQVENLRREVRVLEETWKSTRTPEFDGILDKRCPRLYRLDVNEVKEKCETWISQRRPQSELLSGQNNDTMVPASRQIYIHTSRIKISITSYKFEISVNYSPLHRHHFNISSPIPFKSVGKAWSMRYNQSTISDSRPILITYQMWDVHMFDYPHLYFVNSATGERILLGIVVQDTKVHGRYKPALLVSTSDALPRVEDRTTLNPNSERPSGKTIVGADRISHPLRNGMSIFASLNRVGGREFQYVIDLTIDPTGVIRWPMNAKVLDQTSWLGSGAMAYDEVEGRLLENPKKVKGKERRQMRGGERKAQKSIEASTEVEKGGESLQVRRKVNSSKVSIRPIM